jgi:hypothetical protein
MGNTFYGGQKSSSIKLRIDGFDTCAGKICPYGHVPTAMIAVEIIATGLCVGKGQ